MRSLSGLCSLATVVLVGACQAPQLEPPLPAERDLSTSVWALDLIRTLPGQQAEYLRNIENNWASARNIAREQGAVLSYRALAATPDSTRGWDVLLMTEYADSAAWTDREAIFQAIFDSPEYERVPTARPSSELREFFGDSVVLQAILDEPHATGSYPP